jgi:hypothetical protein
VAILDSVPVRYMELPSTRISPTSGGTCLNDSLRGSGAQVIVRVVTTLDKTQTGVAYAVERVLILKVNEVRGEDPRNELSQNRPH